MRICGKTSALLLAKELQKQRDEFFYMELGKQERILRAGVVDRVGRELLRAVLMGPCGEPAWRQDSFFGLLESTHHFFIPTPPPGVY